ncbi:hypothetical protein ONS95_013189 [Cadophora gregata]|uniref:uncharacterized protein n=1 Tax=Cadophora gregata TaxID=51156 RepID=UPI0026DAB1F1|nr:uncharacterized protein ONS95_013189 [Cadophora gregata]KAK0099993.1 hypothetical protein ONS96_007936 [Cadophora gregata f. sp. sojae]KAK0116159.1 hypothetical protein ONS95_013189 [Cadophora gregata]
MDSVSSSPASGVEFGVLPRTPTSNLSKNGRMSNGKENSRSGSLHKRIYDSLRFRSRSFSRSSDSGSPSAKPVKRRKSIVDLLSLSSRESQNGSDVSDQARHLNKERTINEDRYANLFSDMPMKKRRSLGNLLNPTNILETITNKVPHKQEYLRHSSLVTNDGSLRQPQLIVLPEKLQETEEKATSDPDNATTGKHGDAATPMYAKLAEGIEVDIDLFESRLVRILDSIIGKKSTDDNKSELHDSYLTILREACEAKKDWDSSDSPDSLRPMITPRNQTNSGTSFCTPDPAVPLTQELQTNADGEKRPKTPDSYLRLLIDSCGGLSQNDRLFSPASPLQLANTTPISKNGSCNNDLAFLPVIDSDEVEPSSIQVTPASFIRSCQYHLRETTPDCLHEKELVRLQALDQRPIVNVREVNCSLPLLDLDPEFRRRQEKRSEKYESLGLDGDSGWRHNQENIAQSIASTVARMTRNYHSSSEDHVLRYQDSETNQQADESDSDQKKYIGSFETDLNETWDSVIVGRHLMNEGKSIDGRESRISGCLALPVENNEVTSLVDVDGLSIILRSSISEGDPQAALCADEILISTMEEILEDSTVLRSPLEPFFSLRRNVKVDDSVTLDKEIDFCPEYENFLRRSYRFLTQRPSVLLQQEMNLQKANPKLEDDEFQNQLLLSSSERSRQISTSTVQVRFPGTVNLLQHTEYFLSMGDALSGLYNYKLGDLANFYAYDPTSRTIDAHLIDSPVPNPADLKNKGLQLHWITQPSSDTTTDKGSDVSPLAEKSPPMRRQPSRCDSAWEEFASEVAEFLEEPYSISYEIGKKSTSHLNIPPEATGAGVFSTTNSVFNDDFFLEDQSGQFSEQVSVTDDSSAIRNVREALAEEDVIAALDFEEQVQAIKTWTELAREARLGTSHAATDVGDAIQKYRSPLVPQCGDSDSLSSKHENSSSCGPSSQKPTNNNFPSGLGDFDDLYDNWDAPKESEADGRASVLDNYYAVGRVSLHDSEGSQGDPNEEESSQGLQGSVNVELCDVSNFPHTFETPITHHARGKNSASNEYELMAEMLIERMDKVRHNSLSPDIVSGHFPGYHFTSVKYGIADEPDGTNMNDATQAVKALYDDDDYNHNVIDSEYCLADENMASTPGGVAETRVPTEVTIDRNPQKDTSYAVEPSDGKRVMESNQNRPRPPSQDFRSESDINASKDIERVDLLENNITLADLNIRPIGKAARPSPLSAKGKSKVGALVNIFQDYGLIPEQSRGPLQISSVSPSFSRQSSRYRGEPSETSADSGKVRRISRTLSAGSHSAPSPVNRTVTPSSIFDRPHSRFSDIDTEASFQFGEVLKRTRQHGGNENEDASIRDVEMYG